MSIKQLEAKRELLGFLRLQAETGEIRDSIATFGSSIVKIQRMYKMWKDSQDDMINMITQLWLEERDKIVAHCMKKSSKQKKQLQKKVQGIAPASQMLITRMFIKRCIFKYQARLITWQLNIKNKNGPESLVSFISNFN
jgi:hypothetical protein